MYLKCITELQSDDGIMLPILTNCKVIRRIAFINAVIVQA